MSVFDMKVKLWWIWLIKKFISIKIIINLFFEKKLLKNNISLQLK